MPKLDALSDEALAQVAYQAAISPYVNDAGEAPFSVLVDHDKAHWERIAAAVREAVLAALAEQAGDPEALRRAFLDADSQNGVTAGVRAVAARVAAPLVAEVLALREALEASAMGHANASSALHEAGLHDAARCAQADADRAFAVLADPSPAVRRIEAEARLGRAALAEQTAKDRWLSSATPVPGDLVSQLEKARNERRAALDALRRMEGRA